MRWLKCGKIAANLEYTHGWFEIFIDIFFKIINIFIIILYTTSNNLNQ